MTAKIRIKHPHRQGSLPKTHQQPLTAKNKNGRPAQQRQPGAMKILSWNCRGPGKPSAIRALKKLLQSHQPSIVFLMETKFKQSDFNNKFKQIGDIYHNSCIVDCTNSNNNRSGGLAMFWTADVKLDIISYNERIIDAYVDCDNNSLGWRASWIYGFSTHQQKPQTCDLIKNLFQNISHENWLLFGDFNMVLHHE
jgi:exonuclease III